MKAVVKFKDGKDGWEIRDVPRPELRAGDVEIEVRAAGICGSELHLYHDNHFYTPPAIVGHEFSGVISRLGEGVKGWQLGDRVVSELRKYSCGECEYCRTGFPQQCPERLAVGYVEDGGWAEYVAMPAKVLLKVPDNVSFEEAAMAEPTGVVVNALVERAPIRPGDIVLVQGVGPIGMLAAMVAKAVGAGKVILTGTEIDREYRLPVARKLGLDMVIDISQTDLLAEIMKLTNGMGVDVVVDASGAEAAINGALKLVRKRGTIIAIGETPKPQINFAWNDAIFRIVSVVFTLGATYKAWKLALNLMAEGKIDVKPLISHRFPLEKWEDGFKLMDAKQALKVILYPQS